MPELPEVETVCKALEKAVLGQTFVKIMTFVPSLRYPLEFQNDEHYIHSEIVAVRRRGRYIVMTFECMKGLVFHLGMTGKMCVTEGDADRSKHEHVFFYLSNGMVLRFDDVRRFGFIQAVDLDDLASWPKELEFLGPEPLSTDFTPEYLYEKTRRRRCSIKNLIMDNHIVVGVGNIYANEALFLAKLDPRSLADALDFEMCRNLVKMIKLVLKKAIKAGGTTIIDFKNMDGNEGKFHVQLNVYGKNGDCCSKCSKGIIQKVVIGGRGTFFCPGCQKLLD